MKKFLFFSMAFFTAFAVITEIASSLKTSSEKSNDEIDWKSLPG